VRTTSTTEPSPAVDAYEPAYAAYRELYPALRPTFRRFAAG
jgi:hypothetical protein